ncbi:MAG: PaaI family thioesterase [Pseudomonadota bacterium]
MTLTPMNPDWEAATRAGFAKQAMMQTMGLTISYLAPGEIDEEMALNPAFAEGCGGLHGGAVTAGLDTVCASSAVTLVAAGDGILTVELKTSFLRYALAPRFRFEGRVVKAGRTLIFTEGKCWAITDEAERLAATMAATMMVMPGRRA